MTIKLRLKIGLVELDYEGSEEFLKAELDNLVTSMSALQFYSNISSSSGDDSNVERDKNTQGEPKSGSNDIQLSVNNIATKLSVTTGPQLAIAACAYLTLVRKKETFKREEILQTMKEATAFYDGNHAKNLSQALQSLVRQDKLRERSNGVYALHSAHRQQLEALFNE